MKRFRRIFVGQAVFDFGESMGGSLTAKPIFRLPPADEVV